MATQPELFGTDGIRGVAGQYPLDPPTVLKIGNALGTVLKNSSGPVRVVLGKDTRESNEAISRALAEGLASTGAEVVDAGIITTPGVAYLTRRHEFSAGVMVSASHNPYQDNGIKIFNSTGTKLAAAQEVEIEDLIKTLPNLPEAGKNAAQVIPGLMEGYLEHLVSLIPAGLDFSRFRLVVDCANGAASRLAPLLLVGLGMTPLILNAEPNGRNINLHCGSLHPQGMAEATRAAGADLGVAFDGDADRAIFATREGRVADGDHVLYALAPFLERQGNLKGHAVVGTLMTNLALELALNRQGIGLKRTAVGDKYVLEEMLRSGISLGGEASGHIIFSDLSLAGDGMITLLEVLRLLASSGHTFGELLRGYQPFPQLIRNIRVREKPPLEAIPSIAIAISECCLELGERGRVVVRYSGTEPLARVMVEGPEAAAVGAGTVANGQHWRVSPQTYYYYGPLGLMGEYAISDQRVRNGAAQADLQNTAWEVQGGWVLTGEDASYNGVTPRHPFKPLSGGWGAWQVVGRYEQLNVDNAAFQTFASSAASASAARAWSAGLNWYLNRNIRFDASYSHTTFSGYTGPSPAVPAKGEDVFFTRIQLAF